MKKLSLLVLALAFTFTAQAQINAPAASPASKLEQKVGLTDVTVEYSRPSMKGRTIFGGLVPYDKLWRTGANGYTLVSFSDDVKIDGQDVKAGTYSLFTKPGKESWEVFFYTDTKGGGVPAEWDDAKVVAKTTAKVWPMEAPVQTFTITIDDLSNKGATLGMLWENAYVGVPFEVPTDEAVMKDIERALGGPSAQDYYTAAVYYSNEGKDIAKAKEWMDKAMAMNKEPRFWQLRQQSLIQAKAGDKKAAIETAKKSLAAAKKAGNDDYVRMNTASLKEWGGM